MTTVEATLSEERRSALVRRTTVLLAAAQALLWAALAVFAAFGPIVGPDLGGGDREVGILLGVYYVGSAAGARIAGRVMDRFGRRPGLAGGYAVMVTAGILASGAVLAGSAWLLRVSFVVVGLGVGAALLGRAAVADLHAPERRGRAVGMLVMAGTVGAVGGAPLGAAAHAAARTLGLGVAAATPWLLASVFAGVALVLVLALHPDPRALAANVAFAGGARRRPHELLLSQAALVPVVTVAVAQAVMVTFMSVIPAVLDHHGAGELTVSLVVSGHLGAMFVFSPLLGSFFDAWGRRAGLLLGVALLGGGVLISLLGSGPLPGGGGLFLIGVGWSAAYVASTAAISDLTRPEERASALGATDLVAGLAAAAGVLGGAVLLDATSFRTLALTAVTVLTLSFAFVAGRSMGGAPTAGPLQP